MIYYNKYIKHDHEILGKKKKFDNTIYSFDIETTSYFILDNKQYKAIEYENLSKEDQERCVFKSCMYIWMLSINDDVYYGRTWNELSDFLTIIDKEIPEKKFLFIHNLSFEFQYLRSHFNFENVIARKMRKVMSCCFKDFNFECRCTYMMTNCALKKLPNLYNLPVEKMVGDLDYTLIRSPRTKLTDKELKYCENDCLVIYYYILSELKNYDSINKIPRTSTGHVRRELKERVLTDFKYKRLVNKAINVDTHVYNLLQEAFSGGYTHANWIYTDEIVKNVTSWDFTSSYPYVMVTYKYPSREFKKCNIKKVEEMSQRFAYLMVVKFTNLKCKYYNNFISQSKCRNILKAKYDNGRIIEAQSLEITLTDVDFYFILKSYNCEYEIMEIYYSLYNFLPKTFINFILEKYIKKTEYKGLEDKELEYQREKAKFNSLYGMCVTNTIRDEVIYNNLTGWEERKLENNEIEDLLIKDKKTSFLSFAYGVWVTAFARNNLLNNVLQLDEHVIYCDTDSIKLSEGYNENVIIHYNKYVKKRIEYVSKLLDIPVSNFSPKDIKGKEHILGVFDKDAEYLEFITQGAKKYAFNKINKKGDKEIGITVAGVPKSGSKQLKKLEEFKDDFVFKYEFTNKNLIYYIDDQDSFNLLDYQGNYYNVTDKTGCCLLPTNYTLKKALEYCNLISNNSSDRAIYKEEVI